MVADALGRSPCTTTPPVAGALPAAAYQLLLAYLSCEPTFCNLVVPRFFKYGWVALRAVGDKEQAKSRSRGEKDAGGYDQGEGRAHPRSASHLEVQKE